MGNLLVQFIRGKLLPQFKRVWLSFNGNWCSFNGELVQFKKGNQCSLKGESAQFKRGIGAV